MKTDQNLKEAFAGESQANRKYHAFARKADEEGYPSVAKLFRAAAEAEAIHAYSQLRAMGGIKTTAENLQAAIDGETYEFTEMYPRFIKDAEEEGASGQAKRAFYLANEAEKVHAELYRKALEALEKKEEIEYFLCTGCGYIQENSAPEKCPICGAPAKAFKNVG
ncbi:MAG TPA: rubrerythrin family protein [Bacillota bacterium]|nr:rubrerythrin family protein [Peptococcaceae bacterium MAG4]NLW38955.1 rubrerythrin family protein [Peptococcaceae bacterium]HPU36060.1 rubrerythrin family protein [Bacillota bacterium]HPZ43066.1 rubrerythrin family protein [Bacillota bacterium]HQD75804.1 rubrerythrin family protein [Bacillota bacterium]